jgi:hypothetical protein
MPTPVQGPKDFMLGRSQRSLEQINEIRNITLSPQFKDNLASYDKKMGILKTMMSSLINSNYLKGIMIYGGAGSGKSFTMISALDEMRARGVKLEKHILKGKTTAVQLYLFLRQYPNTYDIIVFDDCDSIFTDTEAMNIIKAATDTYDERRILYNSSYLTRQGIPTSFIFKGKVICITNQNLNNSEHFDALKDRMPLYSLDLTFHEKFAKAIDITITNPKYLHDPKYREAADYVIHFMNNNMYAFNIPTFSLRTAIRLIGIYDLVGENGFDQFVHSMREFNWNRKPVGKGVT